MATNSAEGIKWNLTDLYTSHDDPRIYVTLRDCHARAEAFARRFRSAMEQPKTLTAATLRQALNELEAIYEALGRVGGYAGLLYAADTANPDYQDLEQRVEQRSTEIRNKLLFFELEWLKSGDETVNRLIADPLLKTYKHYLVNLRRYRVHTLSEPEEKVINVKGQHRSQRFRPAFFRNYLDTDIHDRERKQDRRSESKPNSFPAP